MYKDIAKILNQLTNSEYTLTDKYKILTIEKNQNQTDLVKFLNIIKSIKVITLLKNDENEFYNPIYLDKTYQYLDKNYLCVMKDNEFYIHVNLYSYLFEYTLNYIYTNYLSNSNEMRSFLTSLILNERFIKKDLTFHSEEDGKKKYLVYKYINSENLDFEMSKVPTINYKIFDEVFEEFYKK